MCLIYYGDLSQGGLPWLVFDGLGKKCGCPVILKLAGTTSEMRVGAPLNPDKPVDMPYIEISSSDESAMGHVLYLGMAKNLKPGIASEDIYRNIPSPANASEDLLRAASMVCGTENKS